MKYWEEDRECMDREDLEQLQLERLQSTITVWPRMFLFTGKGSKKLISTPMGLSRLTN